MRSHRTRTHIDLPDLEPLGTDGDHHVVKAHANPRRRRPGVPDPKVDRHHVHQVLHDIERGMHPDDVVA